MRPAAVPIQRLIALGLRGKAKAASVKVIIVPDKLRQASVLQVFPMFDSKQINEWALEYYSPLRKVKYYVCQNYPESISLKKAARIAGMERKYFSTFFHKKAGICFRYWLMWVRICEAKHLMGTEDRSITQIATMTGFRDLRTFERAFKRCTGFTPLEFKKRELGPHHRTVI